MTEPERNTTEPEHKMTDPERNTSEPESNPVIASAPREFRMTPGANRRAAVNSLLILAAGLALALLLDRLFWPGNLWLAAFIAGCEAGLVGGLGVAPGGNIGSGMAVFEATHGSAPKYAGQNKANPTALILSGVMMLRHLGEAAAADRLEQAVASVIREGKDVTFDLKQDRNDPTAAGTKEMAQAIINRME
jgi:hypothetical protein